MPRLRYQTDVHRYLRAAADAKMDGKPYEQHLRAFVRKYNTYASMKPMWHPITYRIAISMMDKYIEDYYL